MWKNRSSPFPMSMNPKPLSVKRLIVPSAICRSLPYVVCRLTHPKPSEMLIGLALRRIDWTYFTITARACLEHFAQVLENPTFRARNHSHLLRLNTNHSVSGHVI